MRDYPTWLIKAAEGLEIPETVERLHGHELELHDMEIDDIEVWSWVKDSLLVIHDYMDNTTYMADAQHWDLGVELALDAFEESLDTAMPVDADELWGIIYDYIVINESPEFPYYPRKASRTTSV